MPKPRVVIVRAPGTNCDGETAHAWSLAGAEPRVVAIRSLLADRSPLSEAQVLTLPGGFCHGDDISAGQILAVELRLFLADALREFIEADKLVLGICNGFQVLVKAGLLPGGLIGDSMVTLTRNARGRFEDRWVHLRPTARCAFFDGDELLYLPVAHAEGRVVTRDGPGAAGSAVLPRHGPGAAGSVVLPRDGLGAAGSAALEGAGHVALRYVDESGRPGGFPVNPNGSVADIAGLVDATGRVLGLMPHPERYVDPTHHPRWTSTTPKAIPDGMHIFRNAIKALR